MDNNKKAEEILDKHIIHHNLQLPSQIRIAGVKAIELFINKSKGVEPSEYLISNIIKTVSKHNFNLSE